MRRSFSIRTAALAFLAGAALFGWGRTSRAAARWEGLFFVDDTQVTAADLRSDLFRTGMNLSIRPAVKYNADFRVSLQVDYTDAGNGSRFDASPLGNLSIDWSARGWSLTVQHLRTVNITTAARLVENATSRIALSLTPPRGPRLLAGFSTQETRTDQVGTTTRDNISLLADYRYRWLSLRSGYNKQIRNRLDGSNADSDNFQVGGSIRTNPVPRTTFFGDLDYNRFNSSILGSGGSNTDTRDVRLGVTSRPAQWLGLDGSFTQDVNQLAYGSGGSERTEIRVSDFTTTLYPVAGVRFWWTRGNRLFDNFQDRRSIDYDTVAAAWNMPVTDHILLDLLLSRLKESDPTQGENTRKTLVFTSSFNLTPGTTLRLNLNVNHNIFPGFVDEARYDASGPLVDRDLYDDRPAGFTFLDTDLNQVYTKNSAAFGDWSAPVEAEFVGTAPYAVNKTAQLNSRLTPKTTVTLYYGGNSSSEDLDLGRTDNYVASTVITYQANRRTAYSLTGTASSPRTGPETRSGIATVSYRFLRGHRLNLSYGRREDGTLSADSYSANLRFSLRRRGSLELTWSSQTILDEDSTFFRVRFARRF